MRPPRSERENPRIQPPFPRCVPKERGLPEHLDRIAYYQQQDAMILDHVTARNLELVEPASGDDSSATLLKATDETATGMGARLLRAWLLRPEISLDEIKQRLDTVAALKTELVTREEIRKQLERILDLERLTSRVTLGAATPRDLVALRSSLDVIPRIREMVESAAGIGGERGLPAPGSPGLPDPGWRPRARLVALREQMDEMADVRDIIARGIADDPPPTQAGTGVIRRGFDTELDELHDITKQGRQIIAAMEERERKRTGIASLKIRYNQIFGYYIEVSKANLHLVPADYERKQTLVSAERFTSNELKEYERKVLTAEERSLDIERRLYGEIRESIARRRLGYDKLLPPSLSWMCSSISRESPRHAVMSEPEFTEKHTRLATRQAE